METQNKRQTNGWDVLMAIVNGIFNLFKLEKVVCMVIFYFLFRDLYFAHHISDPEIINEYLLKPSIFEKIIFNDNSLILVLAVAVIIFLSATVFLSLKIKFVYKKEINRLSEVRSELLHGEGTLLRVHNTSSVRS